MSYKNLAGYLLTIAPIVALLIFIVVWEALIGRPDSDLVGEAKIKANLELYSDSMITTKNSCRIRWGWNDRYDVRIHVLGTSIAG